MTELDTKRGEEMKPEATDRINIAERLDAVGWGLFFLWIGVALMFDFGWGVTLVEGRCGCVLAIEEVEGESESPHPNMFAPGIPPRHPAAENAARHMRVRATRVRCKRVHRMVLAARRRLG